MYFFVQNFKFIYIDHISVLIEKFPSTNQNAGINQFQKRFHSLSYYSKIIFIVTMAKSKYEYVREYEEVDNVLKDCYIGKLHF